MQRGFVHLKVQSSYSLLESAIKINSLIDLAIKFKMPAVCLADRNNLFGALEFSMGAIKNGLQPIHGIILDLAYHKTDFTEIILLAKNEIGLKNLLKLASYPYIKNSKAKKLHITVDDLAECQEGIILISSYKKGFIAKHIESNLDLVRDFALVLKDIFHNNFYFEITRDGTQALKEGLYFALANKLDIPIVATNDVLFSQSSLHNVHDVLLCIAQSTKQYIHNRVVSNKEHYFKSQEQMNDLFSDCPEVLENTWLIAQRCSSCFMPSDILLPSFGQKTSEDNLLKEKAFAGLDLRLKLLDKLSDTREKYFKRLEYELQIICQMNFAGYFLIVADFIQWSKSQDIMVGPGRGSGAGSVVAWSLKITDLDPLRFGLIFERFLNPERISMPDFDIDFCQERRGEVINYVTDKYGKQKVAHIITFGSMQAKGVIKDVARAVNVPYKFADYLTELVPFNLVQPVTLSRAINEVGELKKLYQGEGFYNPDALGLPNDPEELQDFNKVIQEVLGVALELEGTHRHVSTHAAGLVISGEDLIKIVPLYTDKDSNLFIVQYSMKYAEAAGLIKFDFLGLQTLTLISNCLKALRKDGLEIDIGNIALDHPKVYEILSKGYTVGVFQFESPGMRESIKRLKPDCVDDLMALSALYRPGPMDNIPTYIECKQGKQEPYYPHEILKSVLKETHGVIIYQEQVLEVARVLAGYSLGKADILRKAMGKKIRSEMKAQEEMFIQGAVTKGVSKEKAQEIFALVEKFAGYGFNKAHAAAYGIISYQTAYLKALFPSHFFVTALNLNIDDHDKVLIFIDEAKKNNLKITYLDINISYGCFSMDKQHKDTILFAFGAIKGLTTSFGDEIARVRDANGNFTSVVDFVERVRLTNKKALENLIKAGCFDSLHTNRMQLVNSIERLMAHSSFYHQNKSNNQLDLFGRVVTSDILIKTNKDCSFLEKSNQEFSVLGSFMRFHPVNFYQEHITFSNLINSHEIDFLKIGQTKIKIAATIQKKDTRSSAKGRFITLHLSDLYGLFDITVFNEEVIKLYCDELQVAHCALFECEVQKNSNSTRILLLSIQKMDHIMKNNFYDLQLRVRQNELEECLAFLQTKISTNKHNTKIELLLDYDSNFLATLVLPQIFYLDMQDKMYLDKYIVKT